MPTFDVFRYVPGDQGLIQKMRRTAIQYEISAFNNRPFLSLTLIDHADFCRMEINLLVDFDTCKWSLTSFHLFPAYISGVLGIEVIRLDAGGLDLVLAKRATGRQQSAFCADKDSSGLDSQACSREKMTLFHSCSILLLAFSRQIILQTLRENGRQWSVRFERASFSSLRAAILSGIGVTAFGLGMMPEGLSLLPRSTLRRLPDAEFILDQRPDNTDRIVAAFGSILSRAAPRIIQQLADKQSLLQSGQAIANP